jgi:anti-anti-sigma factor
MLTVTVENFDEITVVHCQGRIVRGYEHVLLCPVAQQVGRNIVLDLTQVDAIDAAGIGALVSLQAAGVYLKLMNPARPVREILKLTNLETIFEICESPSINETMESGPPISPDNQSEGSTYPSSELGEKTYQDERARTASSAEFGFVAGALRTV